ncbi:MAG: polyketide cyclase [Marmoricola sp.]|nr:polyketide cyclase [Marmoricola sp.]
MVDTHTTRVTRHYDASRSAVYRALVDAEDIARWKVPDGMSIVVHEHEAREGGRLRISLTYDGPGVGKTTGRTDTYHGHYVRLVPDELVVEVDEFESDDDSLAVPMTITLTLRDEDGGTRLEAVHEGLPPSVPAADNELGWQQALARLADLVEGRAVPHRAGLPHSGP